MSEISETEIYSMTKEQNYIRGYKDGKYDVLDKIYDAIYKISLALVEICDAECCDYGFEEAYELAAQYIKSYEEDHKNA